MVALVVVVVDEPPDLLFEFSGQVVVPVTYCPLLSDSMVSVPLNLSKHFGRNADSKT
jgi:hypothetical protein